MSVIILPRPAIDFPDPFLSPSFQFRGQRGLRSPQPGRKSASFFESGLWVCWACNSLFGYKIQSKHTDKLKMLT